MTAGMARVEKIAGLRSSEAASLIDKNPICTTPLLSATPPSAPKFRGHL